MVVPRLSLLVALILLSGSLLASGAESPADFAKMLGDPQAPLADRISAVVSLGSQAKKIAADPAAAEAVAPAVFGVISAPPEGDPVAVAWLVSRSLELLPSLPASPDVLQATAKLVADSSRDLDVRIRAAVALGQLADTSPPAKPADLLGGIRGLAIAALQAELDAADRRRLEQEFSQGSLANMSMTAAATETGGFGQEGFERGGRGRGREGFGGGDGGEGVSKAECRRAAWRLSQLADAIAPAKGSKAGGLAAAVDGPAKETAAALAEGIRTIAIESLLAATLPASQQSGGVDGGFGRGGMDGSGMVPTAFDDVIEAALEQAEKLPELAPAG